jgi:hypothetical protein
VFGAVVVFLQAEAGFGFDLDALDFEAAAFVDTVVPAPGAVLRATLGWFISGHLGLFEFFHVGVAKQ